MQQPQVLLVVLLVPEELPRRKPAALPSMVVCPEMPAALARQETLA